MDKVAGNELGIPELRQVSVVVRNLDEAMDHYRDIFGISQWRVIDSETSGVKDTTYRGSKVQHSFRIAVADVGQMQMELLEPVCGDNVWKDFLQQHGQGAHHIGHVWVYDMDEAILLLQNNGIYCKQGGSLPAGRWAYADTVETLGVAVELAQRF